MNKPLSLRKNISWTFIGNLIYSGSQWAMIVTLAKLGSADMVGKFALALALTTPIFMLTNLQLRVVQATDANDNFNFGDYLGLRVIMSAVALFILIVVLIFTKYTLDTKLVVILMSIAKIIESISDVAYGLMQKNEIMEYISKSKIIKGTLSFLSLGVFVWATKSLILGTISICLIWLLVLIFYDIKIVKETIKFKPTFNFKVLYRILKLSLPLGVVLMMGSLNNNIPRYFIEYYFNEETLGYFASLVYIIVAGNTIMSALGQSSSPRLAKYFISGNLRNFVILSIKMMGLGIVIGVIGIGIASVFSYEILLMLYGTEYAEHSRVFVLIMIAGAILYTGSFLGYSITAAGSYAIQPYIGMLWVISSLISSVILIPNLGLMGAAYVVLITAMVQLFTKFLVFIFIINREKYRRNKTY